jgi:enoyl-CoA hydratase/carnithine racemase
MGEDHQRGFDYRGSLIRLNERVMPMSTVRYEVRDNVAEILLDNPPVNALHETVVDDLLAALDRAAGDTTARAVILGTAIPKRFCAGLKLDTFRSGSASQIRELVDKLYVRICDAQFNLGKPSIAAVTGAARGAGLTLAISCDLIVASDTATFGYPEIDVGLLPAIHFTHLPRIVGRYRAFDLLFTGRTFGATEAMELGLVNRVVPADTEMDEARELAQTLAAKSSELMRIGKAAFVSAIDSDYRRGVAGAVTLVSAVATTDDFREGMAAFVEKRKPVWK